MVLGTQIPSYNKAAWTQRLLQLFPSDWTSDAAKQSGGVLNAMMAALGTQIQFLNTGVTYAWNSTRIKTATDSTLDLVSQDYFGSSLPRQPGEPDSSFRSRIIANLFLPAATRPALIQLITNLTGTAPRVMESWNAADTGYWDVLSYWDVDQYVTAPFRWADPALRYQGFIETVLPPINAALANNFPIWCWDIGFSWDAPNSYWLDPQATWFLQSATMDAAINNTKAEGTIVWRKYSSQSLATAPVGGSRLLTNLAFQFPVGILPFNGLYAVIAQPSWNSSAYIDSSAQSSFNVKFTNLAIANSSFDFIAAPISIAGVGIVPVTYLSPTTVIGIPAGFGSYVPIVTPNWGTNVWISSISGSAYTFKYSNLPPLGASMNYMFFAANRSGSMSVSSGALTVTIPLTRATSPFEIFVIPDWDTTCSIIAKSTTSITVGFSAAPTSTQTLRYGFQNG